MNLDARILGGKKFLRIDDDYPFDKVYEELNKSGAMLITLAAYHAQLDEPELELMKGL